MNREIKFRAWSNGIKSDNAATRRKYGVWVYPPQMMYDEKPGDCLVWKSQGQNIEIMQYTGLKDKNGTESYHKDIIEFEELKYVVEWDEKNTGFYLAYWRDLDNPESDEHKIGSCIREGIILGNVFENSDLLSK